MARGGKEIQKTFPGHAFSRKGTPLIADEGSRLGHIGEEFVDQALILMLHDTAFEFHCEREHTGIEGKIVRKQGEALDRFVLRKMRSESLHFLLDEGVSPRMRRHFRSR